MTDTVATQDNQAEMPLPEHMPGEQLRKGRERKQLSTQEVAEKLNLKHSFVLMIESDNYDSLPGVTFVRGYLRTYAKLVDVDPEALLDVYNSAFKEELRSEERYKPVESIRPQRSFSDPLIKYTTLIVIAALIGLSIMWWQSRNGDEPLNLGSSETVTVETSEGETVIAQMDLSGADESALTDKILDEEAPADEQAAATDSTGTDQEASTTETADITAATSEATLTPDAAEQQAVQEELRMTALGEETFTITFTEECWVEVTDSRGIKVVASLKQAGDQTLVEGLPPFKLMIGNAGGATVVYKDEVFDLTPHTNRNNIARFSLGE